MGVILFLSIANANWDRELSDIKSSSKIYNEGISEIVKLKKEAERSTGKVSNDVDKYIAVEAIPSLFSELIKAKDTEGFKDMLKASKILSIRLDNLQDISYFNMGLEIVDNNATDILKLLKEDNYNFDTFYYDYKNDNREITTRQYAVEHNATEILKILDSEDEIKADKF